MHGTQKGPWVYHVPEFIWIQLGEKMWKHHKSKQATKQLHFLYGFLGYADRVYFFISII